jgi:hypothetical protein
VELMQYSDFLQMGLALILLNVVPEMNKILKILKIFSFGRKLEMRTNCTVVNCGKVFRKLIVPVPGGYKLR